MVELTLPWPPSVNGYWRHPTTGKLAGRHLISEAGRAYREAVGWQVAAASMAAGLACLVAVDIMAYAPDKRRRDLDNLQKSLLDSLTHAGVWGDDDQVDDLRIRWARDAAGKKIIAGMVKVRISEVAEA